MIRKSNISDIDAVEHSYIELLTYEKENKSSSNWQLGVYPTRATAARAHETGTLFVLEEQHELLASMILNSEQAEEYKSIKWLYPAADEKVLVLHTLCVPPRFSGRGLGRKMVEYAQKYARECGFSVLRLDTFSGNAPARALYTKLGFRLAGSAKTLHAGVIEEELVYFEYKL